MTSPTAQSILPPLGERKASVEDLVLAEEAGERRKAGDGEDRRGHGPEGDGDVFAQAAHVAHVLLAAERVDDGAGGEEEQRLEEGVRDQVEDAGGVGGDAAGRGTCSRAARWWSRPARA